MSEASSPMSDVPFPEADKHAALFAQLVMQAASMALMLMGRAPNPMTGKTETDLDGARLFIEQLEMLEVKTKGNLSSDEQRLLKQQLMNVRMSFVEVVGASKSPGKPNDATPTATPAAEAAQDEDAGRKKFTKSYGES